MKLNIQKRTAERKSDAKKLRRAGFVPAVIYAKGKENEEISIVSAEFDTLLRTVVKGRLSTTKLELVDENGKSRSAILKEIQYHPTTYNVLHLDFEELHKDVPVNVNVPIECTGVMDCVGVKLGGVLRSVLRKVRVNCLPAKIPSHFEVDVADLAERQSRRLSAISFPEGVRPLANLNEVAIVIAKR